MNRKGQGIRSDIGLLFTAVLIVGVFSGIGLTFINSVDNARIFSARADWRNEAILLANKFVSDPNCLGYTKTIFRYTNITGKDQVIASRVSIPLAIDRRKAFSGDFLDKKRFDDCIRLRSPEYILFYEVKIYENGKTQTIVNLDPLKYKNQNTLETVSVPVKIIDDNSFSYGLLTVSMSVSAEYFQAKVL